MNAPFVTKYEIDLIEINDEGYCICMNNDGEQIDHLMLPTDLYLAGTFFILGFKYL